jgi:hypothetical protein
MQIDYKITTWERFEIDDEHREAVESFLKDNPKADAMDIFNWACDNGIDPDIQRLDHAEELVMPEDNDGQATLEILVNDTQIFSNAINS